MTRLSKGKQEKKLLGERTIFIKMIHDHGYLHGSPDTIEKSLLLACCVLTECIKQIQYQFETSQTLRGPIDVSVAEKKSLLDI